MKKFAAELIGGGEDLIITMHKAINFIGKPTQQVRAGWGQQVDFD